MINEILGFDLGQMVAQISQLIYSPTTNIQASLLLLAAIVLLLLIISLGILGIVTGRPRRTEQAAPVSEFQEEEDSTEGGDSEGRRWDPAVRARGIILLLGTLVLVWVAAGVSTSFNDVCEPCHSDIPHELLAEGAPHADTSCVQCHEPGGVVSSTTLGLPSRVVHILEGFSGTSDMGEYGYVDSSACTNCHAEDIQETTENVRRGIRVSHTEPLDAGARCTDCHRPNEAGVISGSYGGMAPCLRCHDDIEVSSECSMCHTKDIGYSSIADKLPSPETAKAYVSQPTNTCYVCHNPQKCDSCHGLRLPHSDEFVAGDHAYAGVRSIWAESSGSCVPCHNEENNSCSGAGCHGEDFPYHYARDKNFPQTHSSGRWVRTGPPFSRPSNLGCATCHPGGMCTSCHEQRPYTQSPRPDYSAEDEED